ncbi:hypothetical protein [Variovorax sp. YR566]|uniref:hypothetical protein n=1 Tax=Variovorax sp. YR566 TaxID=3450237 RepID=UPI003F7FFB33
MTASDKINLLIAIISGLGMLVSLAVCIATFLILRATRETLAANKEQMFAARRPYLDIAATPGTEQPILTLIIRNTGSSAAQRVRLTMDRDFLFNGEAGGRNIRELPVFTGQTDSIAPHVEIKLLLGVGWSVFENPERSPPRFSVTARYTFEGQEFTETSLIDLESFKGHSVAESPQLAALKKMTVAAEAIAKRIGQLADSKQ